MKTILITGIGGLTPRSITGIIRENHPDRSHALISGGFFHEKPHRPAFLRKLDGIAENVDDHLLQLLYEGTAGRVLCLSTVY